jgi:hypothetical protein
LCHLCLGLPKWSLQVSSMKTYMSVSKSSETGPTD